METPAERQATDFLRGAVERAGKVRTALAELREHAFASAAAALHNAGPAATQDGASPDRKVAAAGRPAVQMLPVLLLPQGLMQTGGPGFQAVTTQLPAGYSLGSLNSCGAAGAGSAPLLGAADGSPGLPTGERRASPKTSRREPYQQHRQQQQQHGQQYETIQHPAVEAEAGPNSRGGTAGGGNGGTCFEDVLAALRAEGLVQLPAADVGLHGEQVQLLGRASPPPVTLRRQLPSQRSAASDGYDRHGHGPAWASARSAGDSTGGSIRAQRQSGTQQQQAGRQQQPEAQAPLPTFNPMEAERQLKEKLDQVNAAKRSNDARMRSSSSSGAAPSRRPRTAAAMAAPVPRLSLASLSRTGSAASSRQNSGRLSSRENDQQAAVPQYRPWQVQGSPPRIPPGARRGAVAGAGQDSPAVGPNFLPLERDARDAAPRAVAPEACAAAVPVQHSTRKESRISLSELLSATPSGGSQAAASGMAPMPGGAAAAAAAAQSDSMGRRHSAFSVGDAASVAAAAPTAAGQPAGGAGGQANAAASHAEVAWPVGPPPDFSHVETELPCHAEFVSIPPSSAAAAAATAAAAQAEPAADVVPGEAAAPPMQDTPRHPLTAEGKPIPNAAGMMGRLISELSSPCGKLQSPHATPLDDGGAAAARAGPAASSSRSSSPAQVSTASSGSPDQRQQAQASPVRVFPQLGGEQAPQQRQEQPNTDGTPRLQQQQAFVIGCSMPLQQSASSGADDRLAATERSASSIGRKRANSEAGCSEGPDSVKKRSPEVGSRRMLPRAAELQALSAEAAWAAAAMQPEQQQRQQAGVFGAPPAGLHEGRIQPQRMHQQEQPQHAGKAEGAASAAPQLPAAPAASSRRSGQLPPAAAPDSPPAGSNRLVMPVVLQHSPTQQQQKQQQRWRQEQQREVQPQAAVEREETAEAAQPAPAAPKPAASVPQAAGGAKAEQQPVSAMAKQQQQQQQQAEPQPLQQQQQQQQQAEPQPPQQQQQQQQQAEPQPPQQQQRQQQRDASVPSVASVAAGAPASEGGQDCELPSQSRWVSSRSSSPQQRQPQKGQAGQQSVMQQQQQAEEQAEMFSTSVLISSSGMQPSLQGASATIPQPSLHQQQRNQQPAAVPSLAPPRAPEPGLEAAAAAAGAATTAAAAAIAAAQTITPRRRLASLEPQEAELCLREHPQGKLLLAAIPEVAGMTGATLLDMLRQGCVVRKAWVRPNFKQGGSTRRMQLAPGSGGRAEMLYPSGLFRKPLRFAVRRAVVNSPAWRPGDYLVLDTARGMLRLEPASAADHALWVLALNTVFLASSSGSSSSGAEEGGSWRRLAVGEMRWSAAVLLG